jgi:4-hydroxyphenylpyruvate dioxygenase
MDVLEWSRHFRCFPGHGSFDLAAFVSPILANGYDGPLSLEIFNDDYRAAPTRPNAADGFRSLLWVEEQARLRAAGLPAVKNAETGQVSLNVSSVPKSLLPPAAPAHSGFEFLEFAVDDFTRTRLAEWFSMFGFVRTGKHRSKRVSLFQHGQINLILNAEPNSFAGSFYAEHGLSLCATALRVDRADLAMRRAVELRYQPFSGRVGPNERVIPAIKAPDGSLLYFVEEGGNTPTIYQSDFLPEHKATSAHCSLLGIDHICIAIPPRLIDSWTFFCKATLGLQAEDQFALPDPQGLILSRALRSENGRLRITLNTSSYERTGVSRSISAYKGAGLQYLSFGSNDIFSTVVAMKSQGIPLLDIPSNYYEDLAARYQLDQKTIDAIEAHGILYDRDSNGGEFFHAYTHHLGSRFFFEVIERRGGYDGYGAANTPVRIAAHARSAQQ